MEVEHFEIRVVLVFYRIVDELLFCISFFVVYGSFQREMSTVEELLVVADVSLA